MSIFQIISTIDFGPANTSTFDLCFLEIYANLTFVDVLFPISLWFGIMEFAFFVPSFQLVFRREKKNGAFSLSCLSSLNGAILFYGKSKPFIIKQCN